MMGLLDWLLGRTPPERAHSDDVQPPPSWAGKGPDVDAGRRRTDTERDLRRVQSQYDPETDSFDEHK